MGDHLLLNMKREMYGMIVQRDRIRGLLRQLTALGNQEPPVTTGSKTSAETAPADGRPSPIDQV